MSPCRPAREHRGAILGHEHQRPPVPQRECPDEQPTKRNEPMRQQHRIAQCRCERQAQKPDGRRRRSEAKADSGEHRSPSKSASATVAVHTSADQHKAHGAPGVDQPSNPESGRSRTNRFSAGVIANAFRLVSCAVSIDAIRDVVFDAGLNIESSHCYWSNGHISPLGGLSAAAG